MRILASLIMAGMATVFAAADADACACCSEPGARSLKTEPLADFLGDEIRRLSFDTTTWPFMTACGEECIEGIAVVSEAYETLAEWRDGALHLSLTGMSPDRSGSLVIPVPQNITVFSVDPTPGSAEREPSLYKEWRMETTATGTGSFRAVRSGQNTATLVFHGTGNLCELANAMTNWSLDVKGPGVDFRLFGKLARP